MFARISSERRPLRRTGTLLCLTMCGLAMGLSVSDAHAATFTVSNTSDAGAGSLRQAILDANAAAGDDFIDATGVNGTIFLASALPDLSNIVLRGSQFLTVDGNNAVRVFNIPSATVVISGLGIFNGTAANGGGINNGSGRLTLLGVSLFGNTATGAAATNGGGALYSAGPVVVRDSRFSSNAATGALGSGGAIFVAGSSLELRNSDLSDNSANRAGGAIETRDGARVTLSGGSMLNNRAGAAPGNGGALHMTGADIVSISGTSIMGNVAAAEGGALWNSANGALTVADATLTNNTASGAAADNGGGAIYSDGGTTTVRSSMFQRNAVSGAAGSGGAILNKGSLNVVGSSLTDNTANRAGGAIETVGGRVVLNGAAVFANRALGGAIGAPGNGGALHAGGNANVFVAGGTVSDNTAKAEGGGLWNSSAGVMRVDGTTFTNNTAAGAGIIQGGGAIYNSGGILSVRNATLNGNRAVFNNTNGSSGLGSGGAIFNFGGRLELINSTASGNVANVDGGAIKSDGAATNTLIDSTLSNNVTGPSGGGTLGKGGAFHATGAGITTVIRGAISGNTADSEGGGLWNSAAGTLIVDGTAFSENVAAGGEADNGGGAIYGDGGAITIRNANFTKNQATSGSGSGGAILNKGGRLEVRNSELTGNVSRRAGGAIETVGTGGVAVVNSNFRNNLTGGANGPGNGGALHVSGADTVFIAGGTFEGNRAFNEGGALWNQAGATMTIQGATLRANSAAGAAADAGGGGIYNNGGLLNLRSATLESNRADQGSGSGGGIFNNSGTLSVSGGTLTNNISNRAGGAIETLGGKVSLVNVNLTSNRTGAGNGPGNGGALHISGAGNVLVARGEISGNKAAAEGGGLWSSGAGTLVVDGTLIRGNAATGTGNPDATQPQDAGGGGVYNDGGALTIRNATVELNTTAGDSPGEGGGGLFNKGNANIVNTIFRGNTATNGAGNGGAILSSGAMVVNGGNLTGNNAARAGGAIENAGNVTIQNATLDGNTANINGGGLHTSGAGRAFVLASTASGNTAQGDGGALWNSAEGTLAVRNSTLDGNAAANAGGGIYNAGGAVALDSATITRNTSGNTIGATGGGISNRGTLNSLNSVIALNRDEAGLDIAGAFNSQGYNFVGASLGFALRSGDRSGSVGNPLDPQLGDLADNGGPTQTRLPQNGSPAIDAGNTSATTDQRGVARPQGARKDIGAVETSGSTQSPQTYRSLPSKAATAPSGGNS